jgi:hypothetical protein
LQQELVLKPFHSSNIYTIHFGGFSLRQFTPFFFISVFDRYLQPCNLLACRLQCLPTHSFSSISMASTFLTKEFRSGLIFCYLSLLTCWFTLSFKCSLRFISYHLLRLSVSATTGILVSVSQHIFDWSNPKIDMKKQQPMNCSSSFKIMFNCFLGSHCTTYLMLSSLVFCKYATGESELTGPMGRVPLQGRMGCTPCGYVM